MNDMTPQKPKCRAAVLLGQRNKGKSKPGYTEKQREASRQRMIALNVKRWQKQYQEILKEEGAK